MTTATSSVQAYSVGICTASACAPADMAGEDVAHAVNGQHPTGVGPWKISDDPVFSGGQPNPCECNTDPGRKHWLLNC